MEKTSTKELKYESSSFNYVASKLSHALKQSNKKILSNELLAIYNEKEKGKSLILLIWFSCIWCYALTICHTTYNDLSEYLYSYLLKFLRLSVSSSFNFNRYGIDNSQGKM